MAGAVAAHDDYYRDVERAAAVALWTVPTAEAPGPLVHEVAHVWRWKELYPLMARSTDVVGLGTDEAQRRALTFKNPGLRAGFGATQTLAAAFQMLYPGEVAPAHRHTFNALRFITMGSGAHTIVNGERVPMQERDLLLTPTWTWHDHVHNGAEAMVWMDGLDVPFVHGIRSGFFENYPGGVSQPVVREVDEAVARFGVGGMVGDKQRSSARYSPLSMYKWAHAYEALKGVQALGDDPFDGTLVEYVNPVTGGHVMSTIACYLQALRPGFHTRARRHNISSVYHVVQGSGHSVIDGRRYDWEERDIFAVPCWAFAEHVADDGEEVILFRMTDLPIVEPFDLYREEDHAEGHQDVVGDGAQQAVGESGSHPAREPALVGPAPAG